jgi:crossover junction endodeoxyribonuclease RuvC
VIVMGIDPGTGVTGYGAIEARRGRPVLVEYGAIATAARTPLPRRIDEVYQGLTRALARIRPACVAIESVFFAKNVRAAITLGQARGVALLAAAQADVEVVEYSPLAIKAAVTGYGSAEKVQVQRMVRTLLRLEALPQPADAADALAVALCHLHSARWRSLAAGQDGSHHGAHGGHRGGIMASGGPARRGGMRRGRESARPEAAAQRIPTISVSSVISVVSPAGPRRP